MLTSMKKTDIDSMSDSDLAREVMKPILLPLRGQSPARKTQVFKELGKGQQALFMLRVLYDHACHSVVEYYCWVSHLVSELKTWEEVKKGVRFFEAFDMLQVLEETEAYLESINRQDSGEWRTALPQDFETDNNILQQMNRLSASFHEQASFLWKLVADYIRSQPQEFVVLLA